MGRSEFPDKTRKFPRSQGISAQLDSGRRRLARTAAAATLGCRPGESRDPSRSRPVVCRRVSQPRRAIGLKSSCLQLYFGTRIQAAQRLGPDPFSPRAREAGGPPGAHGTHDSQTHHCQHRPDDLDRAKQFYGDILGLRTAMDLGRILTFAAESLAAPQISIAREGGSGTPVPNIAIEVDNLADVHRRVLAAGLQIEYGRKPSRGG